MKMRCQNCGIEIDTRQESPDGTIVCPECGTVYRKKAAVKNDRINFQNYNSTDPENSHGSFWKWQIVAASVLVIAILAVGFFGVNRLLSDARKRRDLLAEPSPTAMQMPAASPTATPSPTPRPTPTPTPSPTLTPTPVPTPFPTYRPSATPTPASGYYPSVYTTPTPYYSYSTPTPYYYPTPTPTPAPTATPITDVFLRELLDAGTSIQNYNWQNTALDSADGVTRQVAFCDVTGDGVPEMLYLRTAQSGSPRAEIRIGSYSNGSYKEIYRFDQLDDRTGTHPFCFFQLKGDTSLYAYLNDPNPYNNAKFFKLSSRSNGTFDGTYLMGMTVSSTGTQYSTTYGNCTEAEFNTVLTQQIQQNLDKIVFSGHMRSDDVFLIPSGITNISVTYEQAVSSLISGTNLTSYYTVTDGKSNGGAAKTPTPQVTPVPTLPTAPVITVPPTLTPLPLPTATPQAIIITPTVTPQPVVITPTAAPQSSWSSAFKNELTSHRDAILQYGWQNGYPMLGGSYPASHPVAFTDFTGDGMFDMLYVSSAGGTGSMGDSAVLKILTYENGALQEVYSASNFDTVSLAYPEYCVFQIKGDSSLYLYESALSGDSQVQFSINKLTPQSSGKLSKSLQLSGRTDDGESFLFENASGEISEVEFAVAMKQLTDNITQVLLSGHLRGGLFNVPSSASVSSLTYDEAIAALNSVK